MMKLSIMRDFFGAETLSSNDTLIDTILNHWGYDKGPVNFIRASNNFVFKFFHAGKPCVLRLTDIEKVPYNDVVAELNFLKYLYKNNVCVNIPLKSLAEQEVEVCHTSIGVFYGVVFNYFEGCIYDIDELEEKQFELWGEALGGLHQVSVNCSTIQRISHLDNLNATKHLLKGQEHAAHQELLTLTHWLGTVQKTSRNYGLIHFDFELDNLIWDGDKVQIIDFDSSISSWYVADIAFALRDLFENGVNLTNKYFVAFVKGYRKKMEVSQQDLHEIPMFLRLHNLETFVKLQTIIDIETSTLHENPQWLIDLVNKLERKVKAYRESFSHHLPVKPDKKKTT